MKKKLFFLTIFCLLFTVGVFAQDSLEIISRGEINLDESLSADVQQDYVLPQRILVSRIRPNQTHLLNDTESWLRLFHYYSTTRLGLADIPFNYIIDRSGNTYEGLENSEGRIPYIDADEGVVLIAYFSDGADLTMSAKQAFKRLIESYSYKFGIPRSRVQAVDVFLEEDSTILSYQPTETLFKSTFFEMIQEFKYSTESNLRFSGKIENLEYQDTVKSGEKFTVEFELRNSDTFPWYVGEGFVFLSTGDGEESPFAINQVWDSFSKPFALEPQVLLPGEKIDLSFDLDTEGVLPDEYKSSFKFVMLPDIEVRGTGFDVEFEIDKGDRKVVQIRPTGTGALTVYGCPEYTCQMVAAAISGDRYLVLEEEERWYKISVDGVEGWVTIHYATPVD